MLLNKSLFSSAFNCGQVSNNLFILYSFTVPSKNVADIIRSS